MNSDLEALMQHVGDAADEQRLAALMALARNMQEGGTGRDEPVRAIFALLGDRWSTLILLILHTGRYRYADLQRIVGFLSREETISQRMLTLKLKALQRNGLIDRRASDDVPPRVDYALTPLGAALTSKVYDLIGWIKDRRAEIEAARRACDAAGEE